MPAFSHPTTSLPPNSDQIANLAAPAAPESSSGPVGKAKCALTGWAALHRRLRLLLPVWGMAILVFSLSACQTQVMPEDATPEANSSATPNSMSANEIGEGELEEIPPLEADQATGPVRLRIPEIDMDVPVIAMGWQLDVVDGVRTTVWNVPQEEAGWHINSAGAGAAGNTIISGRQVGGNAVFAPLALGSVAPEQEVLLIDGDEIVFVYRIREVTEPIPITGATPEEEARADGYFAPAETATLTLVTGWPEFTTTHRIFAIADYVGVLR